MADLRHPIRIYFHCVPNVLHVKITRLRTYVKITGRFSEQVKGSGAQGKEMSEWEDR